MHGDELAETTATGGFDGRGEGGLSAHPARTAEDRCRRSAASSTGGPLTTRAKPIGGGWSSPG